MTNASLTGSFFHASHAAERALERYGIVPTREQWLQCYLDILDTKAGERTAAVLTRVTDNAEIWAVSLAGHLVIATYRPENSRIVSIVPRTNPRDKGRIRHGVGHRGAMSTGKKKAHRHRSPRPEINTQGEEWE